MRQLRDLSPEDLDSPKITSLGIAYVQGQPVLVLSETRGDSFLSRHFINAAFDSTALDEVKTLLKQINELARFS